jgi:predicted ribosomally synthesized peptide with nif11-like leader
MDKSTEFINKVKTDSTLQQKIKAVKESARKQAIAQILQIAKEAGYDVDAQSLEKAFMTQKGELSDAALAAVSAAGGSRGNCSNGAAPLY